MMSDIIIFLIGGFIMAFISEKILDEDLKYFLSFGFRDPWNNIITPDWWVIDREKNIFCFVVMVKEAKTFHYFSDFLLIIL
jgi:hypothetical protein